MAVLQRIPEATYKQAAHRGHLDVPSPLRCGLATGACGPTKIHDVDGRLAASPKDKLVENEIVPFEGT